MKTIYIKISGYNTFFKATFSVRKSNKGNRIARLEEKTEISKSAYYKVPAENRTIFAGNLNRDIHEIGNTALLNLIEAQEEN